MSVVRKIECGMILLCFLSGHGLAAQEPEKLDFEAIWELALYHNLDIRNAELEIDRSENMARSSWNPGMTRFIWEYGQINSELNDNRYVIEQNLGSPFVMSATKKFYNSETGLWQINRIQVIREVKMILRQNYYEWVYENQRLELIERGLSLFRRASENAKLQYETGESNLLTKALIGSKQQQLNIRAGRIAVNKNALANKINVIVNAEMPVEPEIAPLERLVIIFPGGNDSLAVDSLPEVQLEQQRAEVARSFLSMTRSKISPYFSAGYFNQELLHEPGFQGFLVGVDFPLWFFPQKSRIEAASVSMSIAENRYSYEKFRAANEFENLRMRLEQLEANLLYFEDQRLENAGLIEENANLLYESGEIGYLEFVQNLDTALEIQEEYLTLVNDYNQLVIEMYYYLDL